MNQKNKSMLQSSDKGSNLKCCLKSIFNIDIFSLLHIKCKFLSESNVLHTVMLLIKLGFNFDNIVVLQ
jgi:hypothetical protein